MTDKPTLQMFLGEYITDHKKEMIEEVLAQRTNYLTVLLENIYQSHNASAVIRSCDCFGVQKVHVIENSNTYEVNPQVSLGAAKWVEVKKYSEDHKKNSLHAATQLMEQGYQLVATTPDRNCQSIYDLSLDKPVALMFGTELEGLSDQLFNIANKKVNIPMYGFTESFNISVSAALCMSIISERMRKEAIDWTLSDVEKERIRLLWYQKILQRPDALIKRYKQTYLSL